MVGYIFQGLKLEIWKKLLNHLLASTGADEKFYVSLTFTPILKAFIISLCSKTSEIPWVIQHADFFPTDFGRHLNQFEMTCFFFFSVQGHF